mgnify:CR=1 FL=1
MESQKLNSQHLDYMLEGIKNGIALFRKEDIVQAKIVEFMPSLIEACDNELHRFKFRNVINMLESFENMHQKVISSD